MLASFVVCMLIGILCVVLGYLIWKKQKITLIHDYHYKNVRSKDVPAYTRLIGIGLILIGIGTCLTGIINIAFQTNAGWIAFIVGFAFGIFMMNKAQKTYNGTWIS